MKIYRTEECFPTAHYGEEITTEDVPEKGVTYLIGIDGAEDALVAINGVSILPCPFSGEAPSLMRVKAHNGTEWVDSAYLSTSCLDFGAIYGNEAVDALYHTLDDLVAAWNKRPA